MFQRKQDQLDHKRLNWLTKCKKNSEFLKTARKSSTIFQFFHSESVIFIQFIS